MDGRPDPDVLLRRTQAEAARESRAKLKIFFGFAPGVGKTYAMLESARRLRAQGVDVAVGVALTHGRKETGALLDGLEVLPLRRVPYQGRELEELDLDAALARKPAVLIVDELAHTNVPGSRHKKRWQDVLELLDAGIAVHTTLNVQHVESLNDVVAQITGVQVRETVPDAILERTDELELVDLAPEELLERLRQGKVYLGDGAERAAQSFFRRGNLLALRELALRRTAERVELEVQTYREEHGVESTWPTAERILVCIGPAPASGRLVRAARRMSAGLRAPWVAAYVETPAVAAWSSADRDRLEAHLALAESLGATVVRLSGLNISDAILAYARRNNVARIIIGKPTRTRLWRGSIVDEIVRGSGEIDVHVISGDLSHGPRPERAPPPEPDRSHYLSASILIAVTTLVAAGAEAMQLPDLEMLFLLAVMISAIWFGRGPSLLAAALSVAAYDFFFVPPRYTFAVAEGRYLLSFMMLFAVGLVISTLTLRIRRQQLDALQREERTATLYALSRELGAAADVAAAVKITETHAGAAFGARAAVLLAGDDGAAIAGHELAVAKWVLHHGRIAGFGTDTLPEALAVCAPITTAGDPLGVLAIFPRDRRPLTSDQRALLEAICRQAAFAIERADFAERARTSAIRAKTEELRSSLLSSVSHDLRTPLAAITGAATAIRDDPQLAPTDRSEMVDTICEEAVRLEKLVSNLLDMTRLESGAITIKREWVPLIEVVGGALNRLEAELASREVSTTVPDTLPLIPIDPALIEQLLVNLLENAAKYTPAGSPIEVGAEHRDGAMTIEVRDRGPGVPPGEEEKVFERFHRGSNNPGVRGVGLGLSICRAIARAHGGTLSVSNRTGGGAIFRLVIPLVERPPEVSSA